jgi:hypothetical protein
VELEAQWTPTLVLPARVLRASAAVQPALVKFQTSMKLQCFACLPRIMEWWDLYFLSTSLICQSQSQRCSSSALAFLFFFWNRPFYLFLGFQQKSNTENK